MEIYIGFQFLIGNLRTLPNTFHFSVIVKFQFLIGNLRTQREGGKNERG